MKKLIFSILSCALLFTSATAQNNLPKADLKTSLDTLSYEIGVANSQGLRNYVVAQMNIDTAYIDEFYKGIVASISSNKDPKVAAYFAGIQIGHQIAQQIYSAANKELFGADSIQHLDINLLAAGIIDGDKGTAIIPAEFAVNEIEQRVETIRSEYLATTYADYKKASEDYIANKATEKGVTKLPGGTLYKVITKGEGAIPELSNTVQVIYEGHLADGTMFDSSDGQPVDIPLAQLIPSWQEALTQMPEGSEWELYVPYDQAYGDRDLGVIKPYSALQFNIKLIKANVATSEESEPNTEE